jgi:hypothetical protein
VDGVRGPAAELVPEEFERGQRGRSAAWRTLWSDSPLGWLYLGYGPFRRLGAESADGLRLPGTALPADRVASLFRPDTVLAEGVEWLRFHHLRRLERRRGAGDMMKLVTQLLNDDLLPDEFRIAGIDSEALWVRHGRQRLPLTELSDGYRTTAAIVLDIVRNVSDAAAANPSLQRQRWFRTPKEGPKVVWPSVVLIDEVEMHLHVSWQRRIGRWLCSHFPQTQFIVTTHSPYICQDASPNGLIRLPGPGDLFRPEVMSEQGYRRVVHGSGDDAVLSELFGVDSVFSPDTNAMRGELAAIEKRIALGEATDAQRERRETLRLELNSSPLGRALELRDEK